MSNFPDSGSQNIPAHQTVPSQSNGNSSTQSGQLPTEPQFPRFNDFPLEIQRYIFEMAYYERNFWVGWGDPKHSPYWSAISKQVKEWIEPLIWESMILPKYWEDEDMDLGYRYELYKEGFEKKPKEFFTKYVRRIYTNDFHAPWADKDFELRLLSVCDNLTTLECWSWMRKELRTLLRTKYWPNLKILCINLDILSLHTNPFYLPLFRNVTQLDFRTVKPQLPSWKGLESLDNLTHMRVSMLLASDFEKSQYVMDQAYKTATRAQKYFPKKLEYFVILVPLLSVYYFFAAPRKTPKAARSWERMEKIRLGTFDPRIMLGSTNDAWRDIWNLTTGNEGGYQLFKEYHELFPHIDHQDCPQAWQDYKLWKLVAKAHQKRQHLLASQVLS